MKKLIIKFLKKPINKNLKSAIKKILVFLNKKNYKKFTFLNNKHDNYVLVIILAGYKEFCSEIVYKRIFKFIPKNYDVCLISSGLFSTKLYETAKKYKWSYLSTKLNNLCNALNLAINLFEKSKIIYKIDEDIFITKHYFESVMKTRQMYVRSNGQEALLYSTLIPINDYGFVKTMHLLNYDLKFKKIFKLDLEKSAKNKDHYLNFNVVKFIWGDKSYCKDSFPHIDYIDEYLFKQKKKYLICDCYFNIGAIMFTRNMWNFFGRFPVKYGCGMGDDERELNEYSKKNNIPIVISANSCVGHLCFGPLNERMESFFAKNKKLFEINSK